MASADDWIAISKAPLSGQMLIPHFTDFNKGVLVRRKKDGFYYKSKDLGEIRIPWPVLFWLPKDHAIKQGEPAKC